MTHPAVKEVVSTHWKRRDPLDENIKDVAASLSKWNKYFFGNFFKNKRRLWARINRVQKHLVEHRTNNLLKLQKKLQKELDLILRQEELYWFQSSREDWLTSGDRNTKFYHASTIVRNSNNDIRAYETR